MNKRSLLTRLAVVIVFAALAIGFISSQIFYRVTYLSELNSAEESIEELITTISSTASIAAYLEDEGLAKEVVEGLEKNRTVQAVKFSSNKFRLGTLDESNEKVLKFSINHPFIATETIAKIEILPDISFIESKARAISFDNILVINTQGVVVTIVAIIILFFIVTQPMSKIARELNAIEPGDSRRVNMPRFNIESELGSLVLDINKLLARAETQIREERELRKEIQSLERRFRMLFENSVAPIVLIEPKGTLTLSNHAFSELLLKCGMKMRKNFGEFMSILFKDSKGFVEEVELSIFKEGFYIGEHQVNVDDDVPIWMQIIINSVRSDDSRVYYLMTFNDITQRRKEIDVLNVKVDKDNLTGVFNRSFAERIVNNLIKDKQKFCLMLFDLNDFKPVNDNYGHSVGDALLAFFAKSLSLAVRNDDYVVRWGGDEFVLIAKLENKNQVERVIKKIYEQIAGGLVLAKNDDSIIPRFSVGVAFFPSDGSSLKELYHHSDLAMYRSKEKKSHFVEVDKGILPVTYYSDIYGESDEV